MKITLKLFFTFLFMAICINLSQAQLVPLTYNVRAANFTYLDTITGLNPNITGYWNAIEFDIYIQQTNTPANSSEIMRFGLGQYFINLNFGGLNAADTVGGYASLRYISGSSTFTNIAAIPAGPKCVAIAPASDLGATYNGISGGYINLNSNNSMGNMSDVQISGTFPGTKVGRYRLKKKVGFFPSVYTHFRWRIAPYVSGTNPDPLTKIFAYNGLGGANTDVTSKGTFIMDTIATPVSAPVNLSLKVLMEGIYYPLFSQMARKDTVTVTLRKAVSPYLAVSSSASVIDSISFTGQFRFPNVIYGQYYFVVNHFNSIETWSKAGGESINDSLVYSYDFTNSVTKAYGNNTKLKGTKYCLYSGNVNQDYTIDAGDISPIENDATEGITGYSSTDLNGDGIVDVADLSIVDNNLSVTTVQP